VLEHLHAQALQIVQPLGYAVEITDAVAVGVGEEPEVVAVPVGVSPVLGVRQPRTTPRISTTPQSSRLSPRVVCRFLVVVYTAE